MANGLSDLRGSLTPAKKKKKKGPIGPPTARRQESRERIDIDREDPNEIRNNRIARQIMNQEKGRRRMDEGDPSAGPSVRDLKGPPSIRRGSTFTTDLTGRVTGARPDQPDQATQPEEQKITDPESPMVRGKLNERQGTKARRRRKPARIRR
jgi:hypothetical protein